MATICDTNILIDLYGADQHWADWSIRAVADAKRQGPLVINPIIYAEFSIGYVSAKEVDALLDQRLYGREPLPWQAAFDAGQAFLAYRRQRGDRRSPLPDFYIGAHAMVAGHRLLSRDVVRYRAYFPDLDIVSPETHP